MEPMSEGERLSGLIVILVLCFLGLQVHLDLNRSERMALEGFLPYRLPGEATVYWYKLNEDKGPALKLSY